MSKKNICLATYFCLLALSVLLLVAIGNRYFDTPIGKDGVIDLRSEFSKSATYELDCDWQLFPDVLLAPAELPLPSNKYACFPTLVPFWGDNVTNLKPGKMATYRLQVLMPATGEQLALALKVQGTACRVFINGEALSGEGIDRERLMANDLLLRPQLFVFESARTIDIVIQVVNDDFMVGGMLTAPVFGDSVALQNYRRRLINWDAMIFTLLAMTALVFLLMVVNAWKDSQMKVFFCLAVIYCVLFCCLNERNIFDILPGLQIAYFRRILFTANLWSILITQLYYQDLQAPKTKPNYWRTAVIMLTAAALIAVIPVETLANRMLFWSMLVYGTGVLAKIIWMVLHSTEIGSANWQYLAFGSLCNATTGLQVVLLVLGIGTPISMLAITLMLFMGSQLMNIIERYRSKELSKNLELGELS